jgi:integrase
MGWKRNFGLFGGGGITPWQPLCQTGLRLPSEFVPHSLRHTYGTRLGESGADAFTIMKLMGHSTVLVSQRCEHPLPEYVDKTVDRLEVMNNEERHRGA